MTNELDEAVKRSMPENEVEPVKEPVCNRCGRCCYLIGKGFRKKCHHLKVLLPHRYHCRVYHDRLGIVTGEIKGNVYRCIMRESFHYNFPGCPYNQPGWLMITDDMKELPTKNETD